MKLYYSPTSPFARKVRACAIALEIEDQITLVTMSGEASELTEHNPLGKVPCLVTDDGVDLYDSRVICSFLDTLTDGFSMLPERGVRIRVLKYQALADGICDAAVLRRYEIGRAKDADRDANMVVQAHKVARSLDALEKDVPAAHIDVGTIAVACALGYLDLRYADEDWRVGRPKLAAWFTEISKQPCLAQTAP